MSHPKLQAPRGTYDVLPEQASDRLRVEVAARSILEAAGYRRAETPTFEATELFARGVGEATDIVRKEMYSFEDAGGRSLTLRPEGTAPICRAYLEHGMHTLAQPVKLWYLSSFFRQEKPQAGRYRQFWQVGAEAIGSDDPAVDAESIVLLHALLGELEVGDVRLRLGSLGRPATRADYREKLTTYLRVHQSHLSEEVVARIDLNPLRAFDASDRGTVEVMRDAPRLMDELDAADAEHFDEVCARLGAAGIPWEIDDTLVRGLDYYTRTIFEFTSDALGAQSGVGGGGRYDSLIGMLGGPETPGMGWAAGIERMLIAAGAHPAATPFCDLYVAHEDGAGVQAFALAHEARTAGLAVQQELGGRSLKGQLKQADRAGARYVAVVAEDTTRLRDMDSGEQEDLPSAAAAIAHVLKGRGRL
ncbi:MAG: histidine--tRNA ligase [Solirubrobacteraceae bacterium]